MPRRKPKEELRPGRGGGGHSETAFVPQADDGEGLRSTLFGPRSKRSSGVLAGRGITSRGIGGGNATVERAQGVGKRAAQTGFSASPIQPPPAIPTVAGPGTLKPKGGGKGPRPRGEPRGN